MAGNPPWLYINWTNETNVKWMFHSYVNLEKEQQTETTSQIRWCITAVCPPQRHPRQDLIGCLVQRQTQLLSLGENHQLGWPAEDSPVENTIHLGKKSCTSWWFIPLFIGKSMEMWDHIWYLVGGWTTLLKNMSSSVGMMILPNTWKIKKGSKPPTRKGFNSHGGLYNITYTNCWTKRNHDIIWYTIWLFNIAMENLNFW